MMNPLIVWAGENTPLRISLLGWLLPFILLAQLSPALAEKNKEEIGRLRSAIEEHVDKPIHDIELPHMVWLGAGAIGVIVLFVETRVRLDWAKRFGSIDARFGNLDKRLSELPMFISDRVAKQLKGYPQKEVADAMNVALAAHLDVEMARLEKTLTNRVHLMEKRLLEARIGGQ